MKCVSIFSAASKSAMTPSFIGRMAVMFPGVRPNISLASTPTASIRPFVLFKATMDGSLTTMPRPRAKTHVLAVPRSIARSCEKRESIDENTSVLQKKWLRVWQGQCRDRLNDLPQNLKTTSDGRYGSEIELQSCNRATRVDSTRS